MKLFLLHDLQSSGVPLFNQIKPQFNWLRLLQSIRKLANVHNSLHWCFRCRTGELPHIRAISSELRTCAHYYVWYLPEELESSKGGVWLLNHLSLLKSFLDKVLPHVHLTEARVNGEGFREPLVGLLRVALGNLHISSGCVLWHAERSRGCDFVLVARVVVPFSELHA